MEEKLPIGTVTLGEGWRNRTTYLFSKEVEAGLQAPLAGGGGPPPTALLTYSLSTAELPPDTNLEASVKQQARSFQLQMDGYKLHSQEPWTHPVYGDLPTLDFSFSTPEGQRLRQVQAYLPWPNGHTFTCIGLSTVESEFDRNRAELVKAFEDFELVG